MSSNYSTPDNVISSFNQENFFLSNFYGYTAKYLSGDDFPYPTAEHAYQVSKFLDPVIKSKIRQVTSPSLTKRIARDNAKDIRSDWGEIKLSVMKNILEIKFPIADNHQELSDLSRALLGTGTKILVEGNWWNDTFWGVCHGIGQNNLGILLMNRRAEIAQILSTTHG